jgi:UDP-N-acetylglucosamine 2-epimerase
VAASCADVPLAHVEAGMRSGDWRMPEERNRVLTDRLADLKLCPHEGAAAALAREGLGEGAVITGDVMYEVAAAAYDELEAATYLEPLGLEPGTYVYATCHRAENADEPERLAAIVAALTRLPLPVYFPVHPRTAAALTAAGLEDACGGGVRLAAPTTYYASLALVKHAAAVVTDSGGVQREAYLFDVPTATLRDRTEWPETVAAGVNVLADADPDRIRAAVAAAMERTARKPRRRELVGQPAPSARIAAAVGKLIA